MSDHYKLAICPHCGAYNDCATNLRGDGMPEDGNLAMCIRCGEFSVFERSATGGLRKPNGEEKLMLSTSPDVARARVAFAMTVGRRMLDERDSER